MKLSFAFFKSGYKMSFFLVLFFCLMTVSSKGQKRDYKEAKLFVTAQTNQQLLRNAGSLAFEPLEQPDENYPTIMLDKDKTFQTIEGFGGAFTDAAAITFSKLPKAAREQFIKECFDPVEGNGYTLCRTTIHSCDYSDEMYTYDDVAGDKELKNFTIAHDQKYRIPMIKEAMEASKGNLRFFASPWSPPAWMKTNGEMKHGGKLKPEYNQTWADYFVKYLQAYKNIGIPMWGLTVQNEALATQVWESCIFTAAEERDFVKNYLGPTLEKTGFADVKLSIWDHNRGLIYQRAKVAYEDPGASKYIWGTAFHYYVGEHFDNVRILHDAYPDKKLIYTEAGTRGSWEAATKIAKNMICDLNNWACAWTFWNLILDQDGGPRHAGGSLGQNIVTADITTGKISYNPPHYAFGQFSRFIKQGAKRIVSTSNCDDLISTAFINPDGKIAVVILNLKNTELQSQLWIEGKVVKFTSPANGIITVLL